MAQDLNTVALTGRLAADPELRSVGETSVCQLRFAFNTSRKDRSTGQWEDVGNFIDVKCWGAQGESVNRLLAKGSAIGVQGRIEVETWETDQGAKRSKAVIVADRIRFLEPKGDGGSRRNSNGSEGAPAQRSGGQVDDDEPDIPFKSDGFPGYEVRRAHASRW